MHFNYLNKSASGEFLDSYLKSLFKEIPFKKSLVFLKKNENRNEINSEHLFELASSFEINAI